MPYSLISLAYEEGIKVEYWDFEPPLEGVYWRKPGLPPVIGISRRLFDNRRHFRSVLAEELGHHFTTVGCYVPEVWLHYADRLNAGRAEYRAARWAAAYLIPADKLCETLSRGTTDVWELADRFEVDEPLVRLRLTTLQATRGVVGGKT
ncbi:MAG: ImmA/IrrE family metallo-endopeptidase [Bacillota bacterium]